MGLLGPEHHSLVIEGEKIHLEAMEPRLLQLHVQHVRHESYSLVDHLREQGLRCFLGMEEQPKVDLFSSTRNATKTVNITRQMDSWTWNWQSLYEEGGLLCANPAFSKMGRVVAKAAMEPLCMVLLVPDWNSDRPLPWQCLLNQISSKRVRIDPLPDNSIFVTNDGNR